MYRTKKYGRVNLERLETTRSKRSLPRSTRSRMTATAKGAFFRVQWQRIVRRESPPVGIACPSLSSSTEHAMGCCSGKSAECLIRRLKWIGLTFHDPLAAQQVLFRGWHDDSSTESYVRPPFGVFLTMLLRRGSSTRRRRKRAHVNVVFDHRAVLRDALRGDHSPPRHAGANKYSVSGAMVSRLFEQLRDN